MKGEERLFLALGGAGEDFLKLCKTPDAKPSRRLPAVKWVGVAACICFAAAVTLLLVKNEWRNELADAGVVVSDESGEQQLGEALPSEPESVLPAVNPRATAEPVNPQEETAPFQAAKPLPEENGEGGWGDGTGRWYHSSYLCGSFEELKELKMELPETGIDEVESLPVYREKPLEDMEAMKECFKRDAEAFLNAAGYTELVDAGLNPEEEWLEDDLNPSFYCRFEDFSLRILPGGLTLSLELPGVRDADENGLRILLQENPLLSAACEFAGVDDPAFSTEKTYTLAGQESQKIIHIYQNSKDLRRKIRDRGLSALSLLSNYESDSVVIGITRAGDDEYIGDYRLVLFAEALEKLQEQCEIYPEDILGYEIEYIKSISPGYLVPYYVFYFEEPAESNPEERSEISGLKKYGSYKIRAVCDGSFSP